MSTPPPPPFPSDPRGPYGPGMPYHPAVRTTVRKVGAPVVGLVALGLLIAAMIAGSWQLSPGYTLIALVGSSVAIGVVVACLLWLDRWEPEPPRLLLLAFLWGAGVSTSVSLVLQLTLAQSVTDEAAVATFVAPITEEPLKATILLLMLNRKRRAHLNSLTDYLVYAGLAAAGFAWLEDVFYLAQAGSSGGLAIVAVLRLVFSPFAHPLFTAFTAVGLYYGMRRGSPAAGGFVGLLGAIVLHGLWNGSAVYGGGTVVLVVYLAIMVPTFIAMIVVARRARAGEQTMVASKLPGMVAAGLVTPFETRWLPSLKSRKVALDHARSLAGDDGRRSVRRFAQAVTELAFARDRIDRGQRSPEEFEHQMVAAHAVVYARQHAAPVLHHMEAHAQPYPTHLPPAPPPGSLRPNQYGQPPRGFGPY